ncbi:MAG: response regulator transcription factor [Bacteroidales bacterium]|nr:response regulator transcription factor [Bacteroidales bacterium]
MDKIKIIIVDDHDLFRSGLRMSIELGHSDIEVVADAKSGQEFFKLLETVEAFDVALLDVVFKDGSGINGVDIARRLHSERPEVKIIAISAEDDSGKIAEMLEVGIEGFINKTNSTVNTPAEAIRSVMQGFEFYGKDITAVISRIFLSKPKTGKDAPEFTEQEKQIIEYCHEGLSAKMIADRMGMALKTVEWYKGKIFAKHGFKSTAEMVKYALKKGIIQI